MTTDKNQGDLSRLLQENFPMNNKLKLSAKQKL